MNSADQVVRGIHPLQVIVVLRWDTETKSKVPPRSGGTVGVARVSRHSRWLTGVVFSSEWRVTTLAVCGHRPKRSLGTTRSFSLATDVFRVDAGSRVLLRGGLWPGQAHECAMHAWHASRGGGGAFRTGQNSHLFRVLCEAGWILNYVPPWIFSIQRQLLALDEAST